MDNFSVLVILTFVLFILFIVNECLKEVKQWQGRKQHTNSSSILFNATVTENGVDPEKVFEALDNELNYLEE